MRRKSNPFALPRPKFQTYRAPKRKMSRRDEKALGIFLLIALGFFVIYLIFQWISTHILETIILGVLLIGLGVFLYKKVPRFRGIFESRFRIFTKINDEEIRKIISIIEQMKTQEIRNEEDLEKQLFQRLDAMNYSVERQVRKDGIHRIDMVINGRIGLELKIAERTKNVQDLIGQITVYKSLIDKIIVVILDIGAASDLNHLIELIQNVDPTKVTVVVIKGDLRRYEKKEEYIMVKKETSYDESSSSQR